MRPLLASLYSTAIFAKVRLPLRIALLVMKCLGNLVKPKPGRMVVAAKPATTLILLDYLVRTGAPKPSWLYDRLIGDVTHTSKNAKELIVAAPVCLAKFHVLGVLAPCTYLFVDGSSLPVVAILILETTSKMAVNVATDGDHALSFTINAK